MILFLDKNTKSLLLFLLLTILLVLTRPSLLLTILCLNMLWKGNNQIFSPAFSLTIMDLGTQYHFKTPNTVPVAEPYVHSPESLNYLSGHARWISIMYLHEIPSHTEHGVPCIQWYRVSGILDHSLLNVHASSTSTTHGLLIISWEPI